MRFSDRTDAGRQLAGLCASYADQRPLVLGLPRGGVPVAFEVARALGTPLDVWVVRKVGVPGAPEVALGAVAEGGQAFIDGSLQAELGLGDEEVAPLVARERRHVAERVQRLRGTTTPPDVKGRTVLLVDDGIATGSTMHVALESLRAAGAARVVLAVPLAASQALDTLEPLADEVVCVHDTPDLMAISLWYEHFPQVSDEEVRELLELARTTPARARTGTPGAGPLEREVRIPVGEVTLEGTLVRPEGARALVLFAHGSGSGRFSPRNRQVARALQQRGLATLLFDLLAREEAAYDERTGALRFDIGLLSDRLEGATRWARAAADTRDLRVGLFGSSTGAAAALVVAARQPEAVGAVVSRGGRPDLAAASLGQVRAPTLLVVGGDDQEVLALNRRALARLGGPGKVTVIPGATHLFEEPGALEEVARDAGDFFVTHLAEEARAPAGPSGDAAR